MEGLIALAKRMKLLQDDKDRLEEELKSVNKMLDEVRLKLIPDMMAEMDVRTLTVEGLGRVQLANDAYVSVLDKVQGYSWLKEHGFDGLIQPYVQPSTLKAAVKEAMRNGQEFPEEWFKIQPFVRASIVKA